MKIYPILNIGSHSQNSLKPTAWENMANVQKTPQFANYDFKQYAISFKGNKDDVDPLKENTINEMLASFRLSTKVAEILIDSYSGDIGKFVGDDDIGKLITKSLEQSFEIIPYLDTKDLDKVLQSEIYKDFIEKNTKASNIMLSKMFSTSFEGSKDEVKEFITQISAPGATFSNETEYENGVKVKQYENKMAGQKAYFEEDKDGNWTRVMTTTMVGFDGEEKVTQSVHFSPDGRIEKCISYSADKTPSYEFLLSYEDNIIVCKYFNADGSLKAEKRFKYEKGGKFTPLDEKKD